MGVVVARYEIFTYTTNRKKKPITEWLTGLSVRDQAAISTRVRRICQGNLGNYKVIRGVKGLIELRLKQGPGYRVYCGRQGRAVVILLCGGNKGSQKRDIARAKEYWEDYLLRKIVEDWE